jgi:diguanylate cyclase (GGDEF)-like protein/PAS domain S-box-containing protein
MQRVNPSGGRAQASTSGGRFEDILAGLPVPTFVIDLDHRVTHWNRACEVILGPSAARMIGTRDQWMPFYPHARPVMADLVVSGELDTGVDTYYRDKYRRSALVPGAYEAEDFFPGLGDEGRWLYFTAAPLRDADGRVIGAIETLQDVSARRLADAALKLEHSIQNIIIEHFPSGVAVFDGELNIVRYNELCRRILGFPPELFADAPVPLARLIRFNAERGEYGPVDVDAYVERAIALAREHVPHCFERSRPDGTVLEVRGTPLPDGGFVTSYTDITERKRAEAELARLLAEQRLIFDNAHVGIIWVRQRTIVSCNRRMADMFGFDGPEQLEGRSTRVIYSTDEQWEQVGRLYEALERSGAAQSEHQMRRRDGTQIWIMLTGRPIDQARVTDGTIWVYTDITERVEQQAQLALAERVFAHASEGLMITDPEGIIVNVNQAFTRITGYAREEAIGNTPRLLKSDRHDEAFFRDMWAAVVADGRWEGEVWDRRKNGEVYPKWLSISSVRDEKGRIVNFIGSFSDITDRKQAQERIQYLAHHDTLTGLPNRLLLRDRFNGAIDHLRRWGGAVAFMFLDLDYFKRINDSLGHRVGDELLVAVVRRLKAILRESDTLSRQGGDEFILILRNIDGSDAAAKVAEKIIDSIAEPFQIGPHALSTSASVGIAMAPRDGDDFDLLMQKADTAMYASKEHARGTFSFFHPSMDELARRRLDLANRMRRALGSSEFELVYQPQVFADSGRVFGAEALLRWHPAGGSPVPPVEFIPIAEENGLILQLGEWVIAEAARQAAHWRRRGLDCRVAVNVSGVQIYRSDLVATVGSAAREAGIDPACIQVELTESILIEDSLLMQEVIQGLKGIGASVAIDDFGTGYSSLAYLKRFRVDKLKIDRGFVTDCCINEEGAAMTRAVISIANSLNMTAIAEGVEDHDQLDFVRRAGCNEVQGNLFSHPLAAGDYYSYAIASRA